MKLKRHLQASQQKPLLSNSGIDDEGDVVVDDDVIFGRNRQARNFGKIVHDDIEVSDYAKFRLFLARTIALEKFRQLHGQQKA